MARDLYSLYTNTYSLKTMACTDFSYATLRLLFMIINKKMKIHRILVTNLKRSITRKHFARMVGFLYTITYLYMSTKNRLFTTSPLENLPLSVFYYFLP